MVNFLENDLLVRTMDEWRSKVLKSELPAAVEFYTPTCPFCARLSPIFRKLSSEYGNKLIFSMVNAAENQDIAQGYGIMGVPTIKFFCGGRPVYEIVGFRPENELRVEIEKVLQTHKKCVSESSPIYG